jgi:hypothetical protein
MAEFIIKIEITDLTNDDTYTSTFTGESEDLPEMIDSLSECLDVDL